MKSLIRFTAVLLMIASLASCATLPAADEDPPSSEIAADPRTDGQDVIAEPEETRPHHKVPDLDFDGSAFTVAYPMWAGYAYYFFADEQTGDGMNDAIFERKIRVEDALNVSIGQVDTGYIAEVVEAVKRSVQAGDDAYQLGLFHCIQGIEELATGNFLYNLDEMPYIDLSADWWNQKQMDILRLGKKTIYGVSDYMIPAPYCIYFNKDLTNRFQLDNPYELVYNGDWTLDRCLELSRAITQDQNGNGVFEDADIAGMVANDASCYTSFVPGCGQFMTSVDTEGKIYLDFYTEKMISIVEKFGAVVVDPGVIQVPGAVGGAEMFKNGNILFDLGSIAGAVSFRDTDFDLGILPFPKYDEEQSGYISLDWGGLMGVPSAIQNPEMAGAVIELLAYESKDTVIPAYYDVLLAGKLARDSDTVAMMDILFDTIAYEVGGNYFGFSNGFNALFYTLGSNVVGNKNTDFASFYKQNEKMAQATIRSFYKKLEKND